MLVAMWTWLSGAAGACEPSTTIDASRPVWPWREAALDVPPGAVFWATDLAPVPSLAALDGAPVALEVVAHPGGVWAVIPTEPLVDGTTYLLADADGPWATLTVRGSADVPAPPAPLRRTLISEQYVEAEETMCGGSWADYTVSVASYDLCLDGADVIGVYGVGERPADPTVTDFGDATWHATRDHLTVPVDVRWSGEGAGASTTLWFGSFGADGTFSGWSSDDVTLPVETDVIRHDRMAGVDEDSTPAAWPECPTGEWIIGDVEPLGDAPPEDQGGGAPEGGCSSTGGAPAGAFALLALALARAIPRRAPSRRPT